MRRLPTVGLLLLMAITSLGYGQATDSVAKVRVHRDVSYVRHWQLSDNQKLDWYIPPGAKKSAVRKVPVLVFVHGGSWTTGSKTSRRERLPQFAHNLASRGVLVAMINYRLSPWVRHPVHIRDVAKAVKFVKTQAPRYGGDSSRLFLCGHSAGGQLVARLALKNDFLNEVGLKSPDIAGVIGVSGVYDTSSVEELAKRWMGQRLGQHVWKFIFGSRKNLVDASPMQHVGPHAPRFLLFAAERDLPGFVQQAREFNKKLSSKKIQTQLRIEPGVGHVSIMRQIGRPGTVGQNAILEFLGADSGATR